MPEKLSFCRFCHAFCGIKVDVEDGRVVKVIGDVDNPMYHGFTCVKGRALPEQHNHPDRLLHSRKRMPDGTLRGDPGRAGHGRGRGPGARHHRRAGPRSVALYAGTFSFHYPVGDAVARAFMRAIGSNMRFSSGTIDQPGKGVARALHGTWSAGPQPFGESDTWMLVGANPTDLDVGRHPPVRPGQAPARRQGQRHEADRDRPPAHRGGRQRRPLPPAQAGRGSDDPGRHRARHRSARASSTTSSSPPTSTASRRCARRSRPFTPEYVERRANVPAGEVVEAARMFAAGRRGSVTAGTGPNMAPRGTLTEYLIACIQTLCGRWMRAGEPVPNPFVLLPQKVAKAQADARTPAFGFGEQLRVRNLGDNAGGLPTAALADEILVEGEGGPRAVQPGRQPDGGLAGPAEDLRGDAGARPERHARHQDVGHRQDGGLRHRPEALARGATA